MQTNGPYGKLVAAGSHHSTSLLEQKSVSKSVLSFFISASHFGTLAFRNNSKLKATAWISKKEEFPSPITPGCCVHFISSGGGAGVGVALIYLWHFHCELCSGHGRSGLHHRRTTNLSRKMYLYFIHVHNIHSIPSERARPLETTNNFSRKRHSLLYAFALAMAMAKSYAF